MLNGPSNKENSVNQLLQDVQVQAHDDKQGMFPTTKREKNQVICTVCNSTEKLKIIYKVFSVFTTAPPQTQIWLQSNLELTANTNSE